MAEAEKREKILKQELQKTQTEIATMEKVHERLKDEIQYEQIEKNKLSRYKDQNVKRLHHLEQQAKQTEMVASVNIDKILN